MSTLPPSVFDAPRHHLRLYQGDCLEILAKIPEGTVDLVFADPPYFLSNGGITCHAGRMVSVNKGEWDKSRGADGNHEFKYQLKDTFNHAFKNLRWIVCWNFEKGIEDNSEFKSIEENDLRRLKKHKDGDGRVHYLGE